MVKTGPRSCAVVFRYGAVVFFNLTPIEETNFLAQLNPLVIKPFSDREVEETSIHLDDTTKGKVTEDVILLPDFSLSRLQIVADILASSLRVEWYIVIPIVVEILLSFYEIFLK